MRPFDMTVAIGQVKLVDHFKQSKETSKLFCYIDVLIGVLNYYIAKQKSKPKNRQKFVDATEWAVVAVKDTLSYCLDDYSTKKGNIDLRQTFKRGAIASENIGALKLEIEQISHVAIISQEMTILIDDLLCEEGKRLMQPVYDYTDMINNALREPNEKDIAFANRFMRKVTSVVQSSCS